MRRILALVAVALALVLAGCRPADEPSSLDPEPPVFPSEEAAVDAAQATLARFMAASNAAGQSGGEDLTGFDEVVVGDLLVEQQEEAEKLRRRGERLVGDMTTFGWDLQRYYDSGGESALHAQVCVDISKVRVFDREGNDLSAENHRQANPYDIFFITQDREQQYFLKEVTKWVGEDFCLSDSRLP